MSSAPISYKRHRFLPQIIAHVVWLCNRFSLSLCVIEEVLLERSITLLHEVIRELRFKFGPA